MSRKGQRLTMIVRKVRGSRHRKATRPTRSSPLHPLDLLFVGNPAPFSPFRHCCSASMYRLVTLQRFVWKVFRLNRSRLPASHDSAHLRMLGYNGEIAAFSVQREHHRFILISMNPWISYGKWLGLSGGWIVSNYGTMYVAGTHKGILHIQSDVCT